MINYKHKTKPDTATPLLEKTQMLQVSKSYLLSVVNKTVLFVVNGRGELISDNQPTLQVLAQGDALLIEEDCVINAISKDLFILAVEIISEQDSQEEA